MLRRLFNFLTKPFKKPSPAPTSANELKRLEDEIERLTRRHDMPRRIELCRQALPLIERERSPEEWAWWHVELADSLQQNPWDSRADNLEQAIHHYKQALEVLLAYPDKRAMTQNNLAIAYCNRIHGGRRDNLEQAIHHYKQALEVHTRQAYPEDWAMTQNNLANALNDRIKGERRDNLEQAIHHYKQALEVRTRQAYPEGWADTQNNLAIAYRNRIKGERLDNLEQAIFHARQALEVYTWQAYPEGWADTQNHLANAYQGRIRGERRDNLEQAIHHYKQALEVRTRQAYPEGWADTQNNLAIAYRNRIKGERRDNLEQAIFHARQALEVRTRQAYPEKWALTQNNLAAAYQNRIKGERGDNLEQAIFHARQALEVYTGQAYPEDWAMTQNNLAAAYQDRIKGERRNNLEQAIHHYKQALEVRTRQATPSDWAETQNNLAVAYDLRIKGERGDNLEQAIHHYEQALEIHTRQAFPKDWADTQNNLANAYQDRIKGERRDNLEQAIHHYKQALEVHTLQAYPEKWSTIQNNLANAYNLRIKGSRRDNLEQAIHHYEQALEVRTRQAYPEQWADTQNNLATAYQDRIRGERRDNLEQAIFHARQALEVYTRQAYPQKWAMTQNNLATAYQDRIRGKQGDNLEQAIFHARQALEVRTRQAFPEKWADTQNNLANAYNLRTRGERRDNLEQAIHHYGQALEVYTRQAYPEKWAMTQHNLATAHKDRSHSKKGDMSRAIFHYRQALDVRTPQSFPQKCRDTATRLGNLLYDEGRFAEARKVFVIGHQAVEALRGEIIREATKRELAEKNADLYARLVYCCLHEALTPNPSPTGRREHIAAAFEYTVAGKGRVFVDLLGSTPFDFTAVAAQEPELAADWRQAGELRQQIDQLLEKLSAQESTKQQPRAQTKELYRQLREQQAQLSAHWQEMNWKYPILSITQSAPTLSAAQACELASQLNGTLVEYVRHAKGWGAFVVSASELCYVPLPQVDDTLLGKMERWVKRLKGPLGRGLLSYKPLRMLHEALIAPLGLPSSLDSNGKEEKKSAALVLAPFGRLHLLPLAALHATDEAPYLAAEYNLSFVPTLGALRALRDEHGKDESATSALQTQTLLSVAYPGTPPLPNVLPEAEAITGYFAEATPLHDAAATPEAVLKAAPGKQIIHLGCHGRFDSQHPTESGLMLAGGWLTVQRIITELNLKESSLTTLAACESGKSHVRSGDEHVGLTQAIMTAGAKSVVASLWNVNDSATRALFEAFYLKVQGEAPVFALQHAQQEVRQRAHWQHPYYWAAFTVSGLAHQAVKASNPPTERPINLSEHIDQLNQTSRQGGPSMNAEQMKAEAHSVLEQLIEYPSEIQAALDPSEAVVLLDALNAVAEHTRHAKNEADLLATAHAIQTLVEELPSLRKLLLEELPDTNIVELQEERGVTLQNFQNTAQEDKEGQKAIPNTVNDLVEAHNALAKYQPDPPPLVPNKESWLNRLLKKMGLK